MSGYVAMEGMVFQLTPIKGKTLDPDKMYENLMKNYSWGDMDKPGVLLDYYTRRTALGPYKNSFRILADQLYSAMEREKRGDIQSALNDSTLLNPRNTQKSEAYRKKGIEVCLKAFALMPVDKAIDYGEPSSSVQEPRPGSASQYSFSYSHGNMHSFVRLLYAFGDKKNADKFGLQVAQELESIMNFTLESSPRHAAATGDYFFSAIDAYLEMFNYAEPGPFLNRAEGYLKQLQGRFKSMLSAMKAEDADKDRDSRQYDITVQEFEMRWQDLFEMPM